MTDTILIGIGIVLFLLMLNVASIGGYLRHIRDVLERREEKK